MNRYAQRDEVLREMGYASYADYLSSPLWASIRRRLFRICSTCPCGAPATEIHHRSYKRRYLEGRGRIHKFLVPVCRECHERIEFDGEHKTALGVANRHLDEITKSGIANGVSRPSKCRLTPTLPLNEQPRCPLCGKRCKTARGLAAHIRNKHERTDSIRR